MIPGALSEGSGVFTLYYAMRRMNAKIDLMNMPIKLIFTLKYIMIVEDTFRYINSDKPDFSLLSLDQIKLVEMFN